MRGIIMKRQILLTELLLIIFIGISLQAQTNSKVNLSFEDKVQSWMTEENVPAIGIGIIEDGSIKYVKVFGELQKGVPAPDNTIFCAASLTKPVVAMLTLKLVEKGQWDLDEPLYHYWIDPDIANDPRHKKLTTRHVLSHQTGFPNGRKGKLAFEFEPGTDMNYSGEGFEYLAKALEKKFKKSLQQLSDSLIFKPLGMKDTRYCWDKDMDESRLAHGHDSKGNTYPLSYVINHPANASGSLLTTTEDYCKFCLDVIKGAGLSPDLYKDMIRPHAKIKEHYGKGLGWQVIVDLPNEEYALEHDGNNQGYKTKGLLLPKSKRGVIVFTNSDNGWSVCSNVIQERIDIAETIQDYMSGSKRNMIALSDSILERYIGMYLVDSHGVNITITREDSVLIMTGGGMPIIKLYPEAENKFFIKGVDVQIEFVNDDSFNLIENGKISWSAKKNKAEK